MQDEVKPRFYEPWLPKVGQRVRVLSPSLECRCWCGEWGHSPGKAGPQSTPRAIHTVAVIFPETYESVNEGCGHVAANGHRIGIWISEKPGDYRIGCLAAIELEPVPDENEVSDGNRPDPVERTAL